MDISNFIKYSQIIKQGAEAKIYLGKGENDQDVILKERFKKTYRQSDLDKSLTKIRTRNEEKLLKKASVLGIVYYILISLSNFYIRFHVFKKASTFQKYSKLMLIMEYW